MATSQHVIEVGAADFPAEVVERSRTVPVLVDFWAAWCGPCRMLGPVLERLAEEHDGAFVLAKVDTDANQELAAEYGISGIPAVKLFKDGEVVDEFVGALPERQVRAFLRPHVAAPERPDPLEAARALLAAGDLDGLRTAVAAIPPSADERAAAEQLLAAADLIAEARAAGDAESLRARAAASPDDCQARYALAGHLLAAGDHRDALEQYLAIAERDRRWQKEAARKAMLVVFGLIGVRHPLADEFRGKLQIIY